MEHVYGKIEEMCPYCDYINEIQWNGVDRIAKCQQCGKPLVLCCLCDMDNCTCSNCEHEKEATSAVVKNTEELMESNKKVKAIYDKKAYMLFVKVMYREYLRNRKYC